MLPQYGGGGQHVPLRSLTQLEILDSATPKMDFIDGTDYSHLLTIHQLQTQKCINFDSQKKVEFLKF
ncbi:hypothetical protein E2C01_031731 [Portunus trituberculatus]|uniref:Uncharacterized protein n=1 Tax=Portunus trituberculatus TaxID=210409 RepID=A0A5B7EYL6_PORTR|nr:hypothetical protein [Portunus trituberculatus]